MARPKVQPHEKRSVNVSTAISEPLRYQIELALRIQNRNHKEAKTTIGAFIEAAVQESLKKVKMPRPTGIPVNLQSGLWQSVEWRNGQKHFRNADVRSRLSEFVKTDAPETSVTEEIILWDEDAGIRFFLRAYLATELLTKEEQIVWEAIQARTATEYVQTFNGREYKSQGWEQARCESYCQRHWEMIEQVINDLKPISDLPDEKEVRREKTVAAKHKAKKGGK